MTVPVALALSTTAAVRSAVLAGAGPAVLSELTVAEDISARRLARVPIAGVDLRRSLRAVWAGGPLPPVRMAPRYAGALRSLRAIWAGGTLPPAGAARDLLAHVISGR